MHTLRLLRAAQNEYVWLRRQRRYLCRQMLEKIEDMPETLFVQHFRLSKVIFKRIYYDLSASTTLRGSREIPIEVKVLCALSFLATGSYQRIVGVTQHLSQRTASRCIKEVVDALNHVTIINKWIVFPKTAQERSLIIEEFHRKYNLPGVIGCIDCTHVAIMKPASEHLYFNRKGYHSLNVQMLTPRLVGKTSTFGSPIQI